MSASRRTPIRITQTTVTFALCSMLTACGGSDPSAATDSDAPTSSETRASRDPAREPSIIDIWTPAAIGDTRTLKARLDEGADVNARDSDFQTTAISFAAVFGQNAAVKMLLEAGADPNARNGNKSTPALGASLFGRPDCLQTLLDAGADPNLADEDGTTTITALAVPWDITKAVGDLLQMPLQQRSLEAGREECWKLLGPRVDIWTAAATGETTAIRNNLDKGVDVNTPDPVGQTTPLAVAANFGQLEAVEMLLKAGADPNARNGNGSTPSLGAAFFGRPDCLRALLDAGADPSLADENGTTTVTALLVPWQITKAIADAVMIPLDKDSLDTGRMECAGILKSP